MQNERFDTVAARAEMSAIDLLWPSAEDEGRAAVRALLDKALAAIDAGWPEPTGDVVERATMAAWVASGQDATALSSHHPETRATWSKIALAVIRSVGWPDVVADINSTLAEYTDGETIESAADAASLIRRLLAQRKVDYDDFNALSQKYSAAICDPLTGSLGTITDAMVEEAAIRAFVSTGQTRALWAVARGSDRDMLKKAALTVLEYAASLAPADHREQARTLAVDLIRDLIPEVEPREERLTRYRCAALTALVPEARDRMSGGRLHHMGIAAEEAESFAHAMLAAECPAGAP